MYPSRFSYEAPSTVDEAIALLEKLKFKRNPLGCARRGPVAD